MNKGIIVLGDKTSHGGRVITATSDFIINGVKAAQVGDFVDCPKNGHGINKITEGHDAFFCGEQKVAVDGCHTECGCYLISGNDNFSVE